MLKIIAMLAAIGAHDTSRKEINCFATAICHEARGEFVAGQMAVIHVVMNRAASNKYPDTACDVVCQPWQFSYIEAAMPDRSSQAWDSAVELSVFAYEGYTLDVTNRGTHYYAHKKVLPLWAQKKKTTTVIGGHTFKIAAK